MLTSQIPRRPRALAAALLTVAALGLPGRAGAQQTDQRTIEGDRIEIYNLVGTIRAEGASGSQVAVDIVRRGPDAGDLRIHQMSRDGRQILSIAFPSTTIKYPELDRGSTTMMHASSDGTFGNDRGERRRVRITGSREGEGIEAWADLRVRIPRGQTISLYVGAGEVHIANVDGNVMIDVSAADVTTENTAGVLALDAGSGRATLRNARGRLALDLGSGPVDLQGIDASTVLVDAGSGSITGSGITARELMFDTGSGDMRLAQVSAETVNLDTGSGNVDVELSATLRSLAIDAGSGNVTVRVPETIGATIEAETGSGGIDVELPMQMRRVSRDHVRGTIGNGQAQVRIDSGSGSIRIVKR